MTKQKKIKVGYVLSYKDPNYIRTRTICAMLETGSEVQLFKAINSNRSILRYVETLLKLIKLRFQKSPDIYILGFRGHEIFWPVRLITIGKPLVFDEFLNAHDWITVEHEKSFHFLFSKLVYWNMYLMLRSSKLVMTDTNLHLKRTIELYDYPESKMFTLYVGTDESLFKNVKPTSNKNKTLKVFFYGTFLPLHGIDVIVDSAKEVANESIQITIVGGKNKPDEMAKFTQRLQDLNLSNVTHVPWIDFEDLPKEIAKSDICLGGPFGNTPQSSKVITGKAFQFLSMGKPTIIGHINEDVGFKDKQNCLLVNQGSPKDLAKVLAWAQKNKDKLPEIGLAGQKLYHDKFSIASQAENLKATLFDAI